MSNTDSRFKVLTHDKDDFDLAEAALELAAERQPGIDVGHYMAQIDAMSDAIEDRSKPDDPLFDRIRALNGYLFDEIGFDGNHDDYYDPKNSFLNDVMDRRVGIPISLSVLYLSVSERLGIPFEGVSFPGHFLVKCAVPDGEIVLDPYSRGISLDEDELLIRLKGAIGLDGLPDIPLAPLLEGSSKRDILVRMLRNLKMIYEHDNELENALWATNHILELRPDRRIDIRDRGSILAKLDCPTAAADDYQAYLDTNPDADDFDEVRDKLISLRAKAPMVQ